MKRKFGWAGHLVRRGDGRRTSRVVRAEEKSKKRAGPGRPCLRWHDSFVGLLGNDWATVAEDREEWRFFCGQIAEFVRRRLDENGV